MTDFAELICKISDDSILVKVWCFFFALQIKQLDFVHKFKEKDGMMPFFPPQISFVIIFLMEAIRKRSLSKYKTEI